MSSSGMGPEGRPAPNRPTRVTVFEIYRDRQAYLAHLQAPHFLKYKASVEKMVKSLKLIPVDPVKLGAKSGNEHGQVRGGPHCR